MWANWQVDVSGLVIAGVLSGRKKWFRKNYKLTLNTK
jgi:hypothetical protein